MYRYTLNFLKKKGTASNLKVKSEIVKLEVCKSQSTRVKPHKHFIYLTTMEDDLLRQGRKVMKYTTQSNSHNHQVEIVYRMTGSDGKYVMASCDGRLSCWDKHSNTLRVLH